MQSAAYRTHLQFLKAVKNGLMEALRHNFTCVKDVTMFTFS